MCRLAAQCLRRILCVAQEIIISVISEEFIIYELILKNQYVDI